MAIKKRSRQIATAYFNRALFPTEVVSIHIAEGKTLDGVSLFQAFLAPIPEENRGGGFGLGRQLDASTPVELFIEGAENSFLPPSKKSLRHSFPLEQSEGFYASLSWEKVNGEELPGRISIIWSSGDRKNNRSPLQAHGEKAELLHDFVFNKRVVVPEEFKSSLTTTPLLKKLDINKRISSVSKGLQMDGEESTIIYADTLSLLGLRGFKTEAELKLAKPDGRPGSGLTIVVGANNSGKSTVWEAFDALGRKSKSNISFSEGKRNSKVSSGVRIGMFWNNGASYTVESSEASTSETKAYWNPNGAQHPQISLDLVVVPSRRQFQSSFPRSMSNDRNWMSWQPEY